jgi:hypothetical protein
VAHFAALFGPEFIKDITLSRVRNLHRYYRQRYWQQFRSNTAAMLSSFVGQFVRIDLSVC